ncbi:MAG: hypothetical protein J0647_01095, partial [Campylobacteraceae bacterium]|nr:hypothetical protein [Campylobacteraceae bacterium]
LGEAAQATGIVRVEDIGSNARTFDVTGFGASALTINADGGTDANDVFKLTSAQSLIAINAGASTNDTLVLTGSNVADTLFANKTSIEKLDITGLDSSTSVELSNNAKNTSINTVTDISSNGKTYDATGFGTTNLLVINAGTGADSISINVSQTNITVNGNNGSGIIDTLKLSGSSVDDNFFNANVNGIEKLDVSSITGSVILGAKASAEGITILNDAGSSGKVIDITADATINTLNSGSGADTIKILSNENASIIDSGGIDTLMIMDQMTGGASLSLGALQNIEKIQLLNGVANDVTIDVSTYGATTLIGGDSTDVFRYNTANFTAADSLDGGAGVNTLLFTTQFTTSNPDDSKFEHISNIQKIIFADGVNNTVTLNQDNISLIGGTGSDTFNYSVGNLSGVDIVYGGNGAGTDILNLLNASTSIDDLQFASIYEIEKITLASGTNQFSIDSNESYLSNVSIIGNTGVDTFVYTSTLLAGGTANASLIGSASNDVLKVTGNTSVSDANLATFKDISTLDLSTYNGSISLGVNASNGKMGITVVDASANTSSLSVDASAMTSAVLFKAAQADSTYKGGTAGTDVLNIGTALTQNASNITGIETINVNADTTFTGHVTGASLINVASGKTLTLLASALSGDTTTISGAGTTPALVINATSGVETFSNLTVSGPLEVKVNGTNSDDNIKFNPNFGSFSGHVTLNGAAGNDLYELTSATIPSYLSIADTSGIVDQIYINATSNFDLTSFVTSGVDGVKYYQGATSQNVTISSTQATSWTTYTGNATGGITDKLVVASVSATLDMNTGKTYTDIDQIVINGTGSTDMILTGASGVSNSITGGSGNDSIIAGTLNDTLIGGSGNDVYIIASTSLTSADTITDTSGSDTLQLTNTNATVTDDMFTNVSGVDILKLTSGTNTVTLGTLANNTGIKTIDLSAGGTNVVNNSAISNISLIGGSGTDTLNISGGVAIDASKITNVEAINITAGSSTITSIFANTPIVTINSGATLTSGSSGDSITGKTYIINGTLSETNANTTDLSHVTLNSGGTLDVSLAATGSINASTITRAANAGTLKINASSGAETVTIDSGKFGGSNDTISDTGGLDTLIVTGNSVIDFTKISGMEIVDLTGYTGTSVTTSVSTNENIKIATAMSIDGGASTSDTLTITANSVDFSGKTITEIETLALGTTTGTILNATEATSFTSITGSGSLTV